MNEEFLVRFYNGLRKEMEVQTFKTQEELLKFLNSLSGEFFWKGKVHASDIKVYKLHSSVELSPVVFNNPKVIPYE